MYGIIYTLVRVRGAVILDKIYCAIDLKSFYASVECVERGLNPLTTNLVVADSSRTEKTICLAVSPSLKAFGISGRARLFEVVQRVKEVNNRRRYIAPKHILKDKSYNAEELNIRSDLELDYIIAPPRMAKYMEYSTQIYSIYLKYIAPEDIHIYSIDEVFIDLSSYLKTYGLNAYELVRKMISDILKETGITATAGIGTNLYLAKIAMDIVAKHIEADKDGVRIAELDEMKYRRLLWSHKPITDFWRIGQGYAKRLAEYGMFTMGDVAKCSVGEDKDFYNEELLYKIFGINAELLIDHAWGYEPCTIADVKVYKPLNNSICSGQVLHCAYTAEKARLVVKEMADLLSLDLVDKRLETDQLVLTIGYDKENLLNGNRSYNGEITTDRYGRKIPKHSHGTINLGKSTSSTRLIIKGALELYDKIINSDLLIRRISITANHILPEGIKAPKKSFEQIDLFTDYKKQEEEAEEERKILEKERKIQNAVLDIKKKFGKNALVKGMNFEEGATAMDRNRQIGGHKA